MREKEREIQGGKTKKTERAKGQQSKRNSESENEREQEKKWKGKREKHLSVDEIQLVEDQRNFYRLCVYHPPSSVLSFFHRSFLHTPFQQANYAKMKLFRGESRLVF